MRQIWIIGLLMALMLSVVNAVVVDDFEQPDGDINTSSLNVLGTNYFAAFPGVITNCQYSNGTAYCDSNANEPTANNITVLMTEKVVVDIRCAAGSGDCFFALAEADSSLLFGVSFINPNQITISGTLDGDKDGNHIIGVNFSASETYTIGFLYNTNDTIEVFVDDVSYGNFDLYDTTKGGDQVLNDTAIYYFRTSIADDRMYLDNIEVISAASPPVITWDNYAPLDNFNTNATSLTFTYYLDDAEDNTTQCNLTRDSSVVMTDNAPTDEANNTFVYNATGDEATFQFQIVCSDSTGLVGSSSIKNIRIDTIDPIIMIHTPLIDGSTKVDTVLNMNVSMHNIQLNITWFNITGEGYVNSTQGTSPDVYYTDQVNTSGMSEGNKTIDFYASDDTNEKTASVTFEVCHATWVCSSYGACNISDEAPCTATMDIDCGYAPGEYTGTPADDFTPNVCNYCTSTYGASDTNCVLNQYDILYWYTNTCCEDTGLPSDCNIPTNETDLECSIFDYEASDVSTVGFDLATKIMIALGSILGIALMVGLGMRFWPRGGN